MHEILQIAERHSVTIVEDDVSGDLVPDSSPRLAMLDQLGRVIYIGSFSKSLPPSLRVGYLVTNRADLTEELTHLKMLSSYVSCEPIEAIVHSLVADGHHARHVRRIGRRLKERAAAVIPRLAQLGFLGPSTRRYMVGGEVSLLGLARLTGFPIRGVAESHLRYLSQNLGDTAFLTIRTGLARKCWRIACRCTMVGICCRTHVCHSERRESGEKPADRRREEQFAPQACALWEVAPRMSSSALADARCHRCRKAEGKASIYLFKLQSMRNGFPGFRALRPGAHLLQLH